MKVLNFNLIWNLIGVQFELIWSENHAEVQIMFLLINKFIFGIEEGFLKIDQKGGNPFCTWVEKVVYKVNNGSMEGFPSFCALNNNWFLDSRLC